MVKKPDSNKARLLRHTRVRTKISGTAERPRLDVFRSSKHIYAQIIDDASGKTLVSASTVEKDFDGYGGNKEAAKKVGQRVAERLWQPALPMWSLTVAATSITAGSKSWQREPARAA